MTIRPIRLFGDPVLSSPAKEVSAFGTDSLRSLVGDMFATMDDAGGVGLAANQIGRLDRVFVYDTTHQPSGMRGHLINPVWRPLGDVRRSGPEGCLSIPGISADTPRHATVAVRGFDVDGRRVSLVASGLLARCVQHESDHLDGVLFLYRLSPEARKDAMAAVRSSAWFTRSLSQTEKD